VNKKEVLEIRKQFTPENCSITRIAGCYVDGEKEKRMEREEAFLSLPEEQAFKYFDIFKKTLSGKIGKNLLNLDYKLKESRSSDPEGEEHELLMNLRESKLRDPALLDEFYEKILTSYDCAENYYIVLIHAVYDVPGKTSDGEMLEDASEEVYDFILCCICPVKLSKAGLTYNGKDERMEERTRDWVVDMPDKGFLSRHLTTDRWMYIAHSITPGSLPRYKKKWFERYLELILLHLPMKRKINSVSC
jgi:hypothetical protein